MAFEWQRFSQKQLEAISESTARINILDGPVRSGKTVASIVRWLEYLATGPAGDLLMAGKTERTLKRNVLDVIASVVSRRAYRYNRGLGELYVCGRRIYVVGANDERAETKLRGATLAGAYCDELSLYPGSFFAMLLSRLSVPGAKVFGTTNPDSPYHWLNTGYLENQALVSAGGLRRFRFQLEDNLTLTPEFVEALKREYTGLWYKRYILGLWVLAEGTVYDMFDDALHVVDDLPENLERQWVGVDYGTANPFVALLLGEAAGRWYVCREWYYDPAAAGRQMTDAEYSRAVREWLGKAPVAATIVDPSAASFIVQLRRDGHRAVRLADNEVLDGIRAVANLLTAGRLVIHRSCRQTLRSFASYVWDPRAQQRGEDKPLKQDDHPMDALRYLVKTLRLAPDQVKPRALRPYRASSPKTGV